MQTSFTLKSCGMNVPVKIVFNGETQESPAGETVGELLKRLRLNPLHVAVEVNMELCPRRVHAECTLRDGDRVEVVTLVGGG